MKKNIFKFAAAILTSCAVLTACSGGGDYSGYSSAYNKVTANGGMEANFNVTLKMDGKTTNSTGNFKLDTSGSKQILYYEMNVDGAKVVQFSDGEYLYTDADGHKTKYALNSKPSGGDNQEADHKDSSGTFDSGAFLSEFSSFLEAGKIKELGLLSPIEKNAVTNISLSGDTYTLTFSDSLVKTYLNVLIANETKSASGDTLQITELKDLTYKATVSGDIITGVQYTGVLAVHVPGSLTGSGSDADYNMDMDIKISFVNPGNAVTVNLPSTDGFDAV